LKKKLFLAKDNNGYIASHGAAQSGSLEALEILWTLAKELELDTNELLLSQTGKGYTAFQLAAQSNHVRIIEFLLDFGRRSANKS
jgi:ankyrin repeat protein